ncbi:MAG: hypothetical protein RLZZ08_1000 [Pseudomonadota bacterium]
MLNKMAGRMPGYAKIAAVVQQHSSSAKSAIELARAAYPRGGPCAVLDLGCGEGGSRSSFLAMDPAVNWRGVDIEESPEVRARTGDFVDISTFDGVNLPYPDNSFDVIYCHQVLEHVTFPHELLAEVARTLREGGVFVGSVSYLEPYHSFSMFNFTPVGFLFAMGHAGLQTELISHCNGIHYKLLRQMLGGPNWFSRFAGWSSWWSLIDIIRVLTGSSARDANVLKVQYCSTFAFCARKPG